VTAPGMPPHRTPIADQSDTDRAALQTLSGGDLLIARRRRHSGHGCSPCPVRHARSRVAPKLPCQQHDPELWFADRPADLERAKALCAACPARLTCLAVAVDAQEYAGVWGGQIFDRGQIVPHKRPPGRPRKHHLTPYPRPLGEDETERTGQPSASFDPPLNRVDGAARRVHDAESALSAAHQSHVDTQVTTAHRKLRNAVTEYLAIITARQGPPPAA
jgi:WhiB family transcriptional regulator, redox-sensing transcriptional regulator